MVDHSLMMSGYNEEVLRESFMIKRSQNKKKSWPVNWRERWFVLTPKHIIYYDGDRTAGRKKEKGRVELCVVQAVEKVDPKVFQKDNVFQISHQSEEPLILYIAAATPNEQEQWLDHVRALVAGNSCLTTRYHPGTFQRGSWTCCNGGKDRPPCERVTWPANNNPPGPSTPTPPPTHPSITSDNMSAPTVGGVGAFVPFKRKVVIALYDYKAARPGDLSLKRQEEYEVLEDSIEHWWKMRDQSGQEGYAPSNYVRESSHELQAYDWYLGDASRQSAEDILMSEGKEGCFVVRNSTTELGKYTLSVFSKQLEPHVKHYHIKTGTDGKFFLSPKIRCDTIPDLIFRHQHNPGGLCTRLRTAELSHAKWEIHPSELSFLEVLGTGQFGVVRHAKFCGFDVAVKMMKEGTMSEDEFIDEAKVMTNLQHQNLVQLYGVCRRQRPIYIVTEYMKYGSLLHYLRNNQRQIFSNISYLLDICFQICNGMLYLEQQKFIHRDLAARNCLVGSGNVIKVGDFGLARYVVDDEYTGSGGAKFPIKWAAPEVLNFMRFSSKSDVWAFGVLVWEVFTCGKMPYGRRRNAEVVEMVQEGKLLEQPRHSPDNIYDVMVRCWTANPEERPSFADLYQDIETLIQE